MISWLKGVPAGCGNRAGDRQIRDGGIRSVLGNGVSLMGVNWIENALGVAYFAVMARCLGPTLYGRWAYGMAAYALVLGLTGFGFDTLMVLRLGRDKHDAANFVGLMLTLRLAFLGLGVAGLAGYALAAEPDPANAIVLLLLIPALVGRGVALWARVCFLGYERMGDYLRVVTWLRSAEVGCGMVYLVSGGGLLGVVILHSLSWVGEAGFGLWRVRSRLTPFTLRLDWRPAAEFLAQGAVLGTAAAAYIWLIAGPIVLLRHTGIGLAQLGQFAIVSSLTMILVGSAQAFFAAALPVLSRLARQGHSGMASYGRLTALVIAGATAAAVGLGWLLGPPVAEWALGERYAVAGSLLAPFLLVGGAILAPTGYDQMLVLAGRRWPSAVANLGAGLCLTAVLAPAVAAWNLQGAVLATAGAWLVRAAILVGWGEMHGARTRLGRAAVPVQAVGEKFPF
jgi:O-antigen/teichoic acid export membrane protein